MASRRTWRTLTSRGVREMTKPLFSIPPHQFLFNCWLGRPPARYMDLLQLEDSEFDLIQVPAASGVCLYKCGNERYDLLAVHSAGHTRKRCSERQAENNR